VPGARGRLAQLWRRWRFGVHGRNAGWHGRGAIGWRATGQALSHGVNEGGMEFRPLSPRYYVSPQIAAENLPAIAEAGFTRVICNRPDSEVPSSHQAATIGAAAKAAGLEFEVLELTHQTMTPHNVARQKALTEAAAGPVLAYCASGTRCSVIWALGQADQIPVDDILAATTAAGYQLEGLRPALEQIATKGT